MYKEYSYQVVSLWYSHTKEIEVAHKVQVNAPYWCGTSLGQVLNILVSNFSIDIQIFHFSALKNRYKKCKWCVKLEFRLTILDKVLPRCWLKLILSGYYFLWYIYYDLSIRRVCWRVWKTFWGTSSPYPWKSYFCCGVHALSTIATPWH